MDFLDSIDPVVTSLPVSQILPTPRSYTGTIKSFTYPMQKLEALHAHVPITRKVRRAP